MIAAGPCSRLCAACAGQGRQLTLGLLTGACPPARLPLQEKNRLLGDFKRLREHYSKYEPTILELKKKYEGALREKALLALERDRCRGKVRGQHRGSFAGVQAGGLHGGSRRCREPPRLDLWQPRRCARLPRSCTSWRRSWA